MTTWRTDWPGVVLLIGAFVMLLTALRLALRGVESVL